MAYPIVIPPYRVPRRSSRLRGLVGIGALGADLPVLKRGSTGAAVKLLQKALTYVGQGPKLSGAVNQSGHVIDQAKMDEYSASLASSAASAVWIAKYADGSFGPNTEAAVRSFQEGYFCVTEGGCDTGVVDAATWSALKARAGLFAADFDAMAKGQVTVTPQSAPPPPPVVTVTDVKPNADGTTTATKSDGSTVTVTPQGQVVDSTPPSLLTKYKWWLIGGGVSIAALVAAYAASGGLSAMDALGELSGFKSRRRRRRHRHRGRR